MPLNSMYGTTIRGPSGVSIADRVLEADEEALLEQPPAQVVGDAQAGRGLELGVDLAQRARGLLGVELDEALALLREHAERALRRAQRGPAQAVLGVRDAEVGERLGRRVERARGVLLGDLARDEPHLAAGRQAVDRLVRRGLDDRAARASALCSAPPRMSRKNAATGNASSHTGGRTPWRSSSSVVQLLRRRRRMT